MPSAPDDRELVLLSGGLSLEQSLADALTQRAFRECFLTAEVPLPRNAQEFSNLLLAPDFIETTPRPWLDYLSRYLKAITRRIERLPPNVRRDAELAAKIRPINTAMLSLLAQPALSGVRPELEELRWMIEEFRVSLFAQELKTMIRVSEKRLAEQLSLAREAQR